MFAVHFTTEPLVNPLPETVSVNAGLKAWTEEGFRELITGAEEAAVYV